MAVFLWPRTILVPQNAGPPCPVPNNTSGGVSIGGTEQIIGNTPGRWKMTYDGIRVHTREQVLAWNKLAGQLRGRANSVVIPIYDELRSPDIASAWVIVGGAVTKGSVTCQIKRNNAVGALEEGQHFGVLVGDDAYRLYRITSIDDIDTTDPVHPIYTVHFIFPAREGIPNGTTVTTWGGDLYFRCRLAKDDGMDMSLSMWKRGTPSVDFVEDV